MKRILVVQGANMSRLGKRSPELYGLTTAAELDELIRQYADRIGYCLLYTSPSPRDS